MMSGSAAPDPVPARHICVFCGAKTGRDPAYSEAARALAQELVRRGFGLVFGGGAVGLMGVTADAVLEAGGHVTGVIPAALMAREVGHGDVTELRVVDSMHDRKALMADLADGFVALPGGLGTLEEILEVVTWQQLGIHRKPCGLLDVGGYWQPLIELLDHAVEQGFVPAENRDLLLHASDPAVLLDRFDRYRSPIRRRWLDIDDA